ncbi:MAG: hypothetical protein O7F12_12455 [Nitrospirae bacterium]|nr:hypothetical protein [Nitrospirota bacterium]
MGGLIKFVMLVFLAFNLTACGTTWFANPVTNPVIEDKVGKWGEEVVGTLAVKADRRIVLVKLQPDSQFCAEPPPDVAENITKELALALEAKVKEPQSGIDATGKVDLNDKLLIKIQELIKRTQGVDLYRTGMYDICQNFLNGAITAAGVSEQSKLLLEASTKLIALELELTAKTTQAQAQAQEAQAKATLAQIKATKAKPPI